MFKTVVLLICITGVARAAGGDPAATKFVNDYLKSLKSNQTPIFQSECELRNGGKAVLILPVGRQKGLFIEYAPDTMVGNTAEVKWTRGQWESEINQGGEYTIRRLDRLIHERLLGDFQIILPNRLETASSSRPRKSCTESPQ